MGDVVMQSSRHIITITRKSDGSVVRVMRAVHYFIDFCEHLKGGIPHIKIYYEDRDGNYRTAFYPLALYNFEILEI